MTDNVEAKEVQQAPKLLQNLMQIPAWAYGAFLVLGICATGGMPVWAAVLILVGGGLFMNSLSNARKLEEAKARAASFANCIGPIVVGSMHPGETIEDIDARAAFWKEQLALSGNPYADKIPVIVYPYMPILVQHGQLPAGWSIYCKMLGEQQHLENIKWHEGKCPQELKGLFASAVLPAPKQPEQ